MRHPATPSLMLELCPPWSAIMHLSFVFGFHPLPAFTLSVTKPQAAPPSWVLPQMRLFFPTPYFWGTAALTRSAPLRVRLTETWGLHPREHLWDHAAVDTQRLWLGASPPQKKFTRLCSSSISGIMVSQHASGTRLHPQLPCSSTSECDFSPGSTGAFAYCGGAHSLYQVSSQQGNHYSHVAQRLPDFTLLLGIRLSHQNTSR